MQYKFFPAPDLNSLSEYLLSLSNDEGINSIMLLTCDKDNISTDEYAGILKQVKKTVFGGVFPGFSYGFNTYQTGFFVAGFYEEATCTVFENISSDESDFNQVLEKNLHRYKGTQTMFIFMDGLAKKIENLLDSLFVSFGLEFNYIGGGAGSLSFTQKPCIITNDGVLQDAVIIAGFKRESGVAVKHGWTSVSRSVKVTSVVDNEIKELDYKPAFDVYRDIIFNYSGVKVDHDDVFKSARLYPFGINKIDSEKVVRGPIFVSPDNGLICVGEVQKGCFIEVLNGTKETLINAAGLASKLAKENKKDKNYEFVFIADCISCVVFLGEDFNKKLVQIISYTDTDIPVFGILCLGEIANNGKDYLDFYNKTTVVGFF